MFRSPMSNVTEQVEAAVDVWPYVDALNLDELGIPYLKDVHYVYRDAREGALR